MQFVSPQPYEEALAKLGSRGPVGSLLNSTEWREVPVALRERAFFSSQVENVRFLQRAQDALKDYLAGARETLPDGQTVLKTGSRAAFVDQLRRFALAEGMGPLDPKDKGGLKDITSETRLALIFDTQTKAARDYGNWKQGMDPVVLDEFPAQRFMRVRRVKIPRPYHQAAIGQVRLKTDTAFWVGLNPDFGVPWGPWGYNSGCDVEDVDRAGAEQRKLLTPGQPVRPVDKKFNDGLQASLKGLDQALVDKLQSAFGAQITVRGDTVFWSGGAVPPTPRAPHRKAVTPPPAPVTPPAGPVEPPAGPAAVSAKPAVSEAITNRISDRATRGEVTRVLALVDQVHRDGDLRALPVDGRVAPKSLGTYYPSESRIAVSKAGGWPGLTFAHELGHALDHQALEPLRPGFSSRSLGISAPGSLLAEWNQAVQASAAVTTLRERLARAGGGRSARYLRYLLDPAELWARAYAQYIAELSGDTGLLTGINRSTATDPGRQWDQADFAPVRASIDALFHKLGWITTSPPPTNP